MVLNARSSLRGLVTAIVVSFAVSTQEVNAGWWRLGTIALGVGHDVGDGWKNYRTAKQNRISNDSWQEHIMRPILRHDSRNSGVAPMDSNNKKWLKRD